MPRSMTGFGRGECLRYNRRFKVELKSVNHRFSDYTIKIPRFLNPLEDKIRRRLAEAIARGKVDLWVNFESFTAHDATISINEAYADAYVDALKMLRTRYGLSDVPPSTILDLLSSVPEVVVFDRYESALSTDGARAEIWETLSEALEQAIIRFNTMRDAEGVALVSDIESKYVRACEVLAEIKRRLPLAVNEQAARTKERIGELVARLGSKPDEGRLITEIALLADKSDVDEELIRLESHFSQLAKMLWEEGAVGRKMDFLVQEMNREANTIGSKSTDTQLTNAVVEIKSLIEKIREQAQNIE